MDSTTTTFYAVRIICIRKDGEPVPDLWVHPPAFGSEYVLRESMGHRFRTITEAKRALKYACVRDQLKSKRVVCPKKAAVLVKKHGKDFYAPWHGRGEVPCRYEAEVLKIVETRSYETEIVTALPKRGALEQLARTAQ